MMHKFELFIRLSASRRNDSMLSFRTLLLCGWRRRKEESARRMSLFGQNDSATTAEEENAVGLTHHFPPYFFVHMSVQGIGFVIPLKSSSMCCSAAIWNLVRTQPRSLLQHTIKGNGYLKTLKSDPLSEIVASQISHYVSSVS